MSTTVIIPTRQEIFLDKTVNDVLNNAVGEVEVLVVLDAYDLPEGQKNKDKRVRYLNLPKSFDLHKRQAINLAVEQSSCDHIMPLDAHCMMGYGFDVILERDCKEDWVMIPRRERLDAEAWQVYHESGRCPIDYEYFMWREFVKGGIHGYRWDSRTRERVNLQIDDTLAFQGSCYFMHKDWFKELGLMQTKGYTGWGQESEEVSLKTHRAGGRVMSNKNTWFAHLHKGKKYGRMYKVKEGGLHLGDAYGFDQYVNKNRKLFVNLINSFMPIPNWPEDWEKHLPKI